jgi:septal ring factor EnvC (AmiA/AmiB activator)
MKQNIFTVIAIMTVILSALACISETVTVMTAEVNSDVGRKTLTDQLKSARGREETLTDQLKSARDREETLTDQLKSARGREETLIDQLKSARYREETLIDQLKSAGGRGDFNRPKKFYNNKQYICNLKNLKNVKD